MRCFGRAVGFAAGTLRAFDLMVLRDEDLPTDDLATDDLAAPPAPVHFFLTAGRAAARDVAFCLAMSALPFFVDREKLAQNSIFVGWAKAHSAEPTFRAVLVKVGTLALCPPYEIRGLVAPKRAKADQCNRNTPFTARSSAGLISRECATVTE